MTTVFALLNQVCGLTLREAETFLDTREDTLKSWSSGRRTAPDRVLSKLFDLSQLIDAAADRAVDKIAIATISLEGEGVIELGVASDDHEAQGLGWPCVGVHRAVLALIVTRGMAEGYNFEIVPRCSTLGSARAADAHRK